METSHEIDVVSLDPLHRRAFEDVIGTPLQQNQRLVISVTERASSRPPQSIDEWAGVYSELTGDQIEDIDRDIRTRANLTRGLS